MHLTLLTFMLLTRESVLKKTREESKRGCYKNEAPKKPLCMLLVVYDVVLKDRVPNTCNSVHIQVGSV